VDISDIKFKYLGKAHKHEHQKYYRSAVKNECKVIDIYGIGICCTQFVLQYTSYFLYGMVYKLVYTSCI